MIFALVGFVLLLISGCMALGLVYLSTRPQSLGWLTALTYAHGVMLVGAFITLMLAFLNDQWVISYVAQHAHSQLPWIYKCCAVWGGHEGSLLLWATILGLWMCVLWLLKGPMSPAYLRRVIGVLALIAVGFEWFMLMTSNPFLVLSQVPIDGADLNPLLQDPGMVSHPPMLYVGYVGFAVTYACAIAGLLTPADRAQWSRWARPWVLFAWASLTVGIVLGSAWAYRELGWGGWWFWDPVENASFMPWLVGTALIHSLMLAERMPQFTHWAALLAVFGFVLSLLGTFLVRSGVLISVHAFAVDASRGVYLLVFLAVVLVGSLWLLLYTYQQSEDKTVLAWHTRPQLLLYNNLCFTIAMSIVLLGTLFPIIYQMLTANPLSIGAPYFNQMLWPITVALMILMGLAVRANWQGLKLNMVHECLWVCLALGLAVITHLWMSRSIELVALVAFTLVYWLLIMHRAYWFTLNRYKWPVTMAHLGFMVTVIGITMTSQFSYERLLDMRLGETVKDQRGALTWQQAATYQGENYWAMKLFMQYQATSGHIMKLTPEYRVYTAAQTPLPHASIAPYWWGDYYVNVGQSRGDGIWMIRLQFKPFVRWIWLGGLMMAMGGLISAVRVRRD